MTNLAQLHSTVRVRFDGRQALTTGSGIYHSGPYQVIADNGVACRISGPDENGFVTETSVRFLDANHLEVVDHRTTLAGTAVLERNAIP